MNSPSYYDIARQKYPTRYLKGAGRFAVVPLDAQTVTMFMTRDEAEAHILNPMRCMIVDLVERQIDFDSIPDRKDADELRRERRERRARNANI